MSKEESGEEAQVKANDASKKDADIYENRGSKKLIRLITVMAYMFSVSFVAIVLSAYYIFLWEPPNPKLLRKPVHLSGEPELQFLLSDSPIVSNQSHEFQSENFSTHILPKKLTSRIADETDANDRLDESLFLLRTSLMEYLRDRSNDSKPSQDSPPNSWETSNSTKYASLEERKKSNSMEKPSEENAEFDASSKDSIENKKINVEITSSKVDDYVLSSPTVIPSRISENETNKVRFMSTRNSTIRKSSQRVYEFNRNFTRNTTAGREKSEKSVPANFRLEKDTRIEENKESSESRGKRDFTHSTSHPVNNRASINSSRISVFANRLKFPQQSNLSSATLTNIAMNFTETQTEMTTKSVTMGNKQTPEPEIITTQQQEDLTTILTESTEMSSSSVSPVTITEDFRTNLSTESEDTPIKMDPEST